LAINGLLDAPKKMKEMGIRSRQRVEQFFSWSSIARQTLEFYQDLISKTISH
jgi:starch synthase